MKNTEMSFTIDKWYDVTCKRCGKHRSTDFGMAFAETAREIRIYAKREGWRKVANWMYCPECMKLWEKELKE